MRTLPLITNLFGVASQKLNSVLKPTRSILGMTLFDSCAYDEFMEVWRKCSSCKREIGFGQNYFVCSVSTCNGQRTGYVFCTLHCWEFHLPGAKHRDAAAVETEAPAGPSVEPAARKIIVASSTSASPAGSARAVAQIPREVLIVASKLKDYIRARSEMNTSAGVFEALSDIVRRECDKAIERAREDGRKTVLDRDFK